MVTTVLILGVIVLFVCVGNTINHNQLVKETKRLGKKVIELYAHANAQQLRIQALEIPPRDTKGRYSPHTTAVDKLSEERVNNRVRAGKPRTWTEARDKAENQEEESQP
jgi:hypothetical protein